MTMIPQQAVEWLVNEPSAANKGAFDRRYGPGAAEQAIAEFNIIQDEPVVEPVHWSQKALKGAGLVAADVGEGLLEAPVTIASGLYEGAIAQPASMLSSLVGDVLIYNNENGEWFDYISPEEFAQRDAEGRNHLTDLNPLVGLGEDTFTGQLINDASQFTGAFVGLGKLFKGGKLILGSGKAGAASGVAVQSAGASFAGFGGNDGRMTDLLLELGVPDEMLPDFLETDPDDPEMLGRLKNVLEEGPLGALGVIGVRAITALRKGDEAGFKQAMIEAKAAHDGVLARAEVDLAEETPIAGDIKPAEAPSALEMDHPSFSMTEAHHRRLESVSEKLAKNPDATIKGSMGWRSFDLIDAPEAVEAEIAATARVLESQFKTVKGAPQSEAIWKEQAASKARDLAELTGVDDQAILNQVSRFDDPTQMAADLMARENYALSLAENITEIAKAVRRYDDFGDVEAINALGYKTINEAKLAILQRRELAANVLAASQGARTNIARAMRAMQVARSGDEVLLRMIGKNQGLARSADEIVSAALDNANSAPLLKSVAEAKGTWGQAINYYRINALLSGPGTQEVNMISNGINALALPFQQAIGGLATGDAKIFMHALRQYRGMWAGAYESIRTALKAGYNDAAILDPFNGKLDVEDGVSANGNVATKAIGLPTRFLMTADEFFKQAQYRGRIFADAVGDAQDAGLKGDASSKFISDYIAKSFDEKGAATRGDALHQAQRATFTEELDGSASRTFQKFVVDHEAMRFFVPFVKTPLNILSQGFQHIPVMGVLSGRLRRDIAAGGSARAQAIGKQAIGAALTFTAASLAIQGRITGSGPKDPRVRAQWLRTNKPYSFVSIDENGTKTFTPYQRLEPLSYPIALVADFVELMKHRQAVSRIEAGEMAAAVVSVIAENTVNRSFTQGLADMFELLVDPERSGERWVASAIGSFVPNAIPQIMDKKELVEIRGVFDDALARIGMDGSLDRRRNALGEIDFRRGSRMDPLGLVAKDVRTNDVVLEEFSRLSVVHQSGFGTPPSRMGDIDLKDERYSDEQSYFDRWMELQGEIKIGNKTLRQRLTQVIQSNSYQRLSDGNRDFTGENETYLKKIILQYRNAAKAKLMREDDGFAQIIKNYELARRNIKRRSNPTFIEDILTNATR